jgi:large subunit ribosomal protein L10
MWRFLLSGINVDSTGGVKMSVIEQKKQIVQDIADKFKASKSTIVVDYRGLTVSEVTELRKQLREAGVEFKVFKNTLVNNNF